jgi:hypothetical protein
MRVRGQPTSIVDALGSNYGVPYYPDFDRIACQCFAAPSPEREDENLDKICNRAVSRERQSPSKVVRGRGRGRWRGSEQPPPGTQDESVIVPLHTARFRHEVILGNGGQQEDVVAR